MNNMSATHDEARIYTRKGKLLTHFVFSVIDIKKLEKAISFIPENKTIRFENEIFLSRMFLVDLLLYQYFGDSKERLFIGEAFFEEMMTITELPKSAIAEALASFQEIANIEFGDTFFGRLQMITFDNAELKKDVDYSAKDYIMFKLKWFFPESASLIHSLQSFIEEGMPLPSSDKDFKPTMTKVQGTGCLLPILNVLILCMLLFAWL